MNSNGSASYIPDGYSTSIYLREVPGLHCPVRLTYRPMTIMQQAQVQREMASAADDWEKRQWIAGRWITQHVIQWNITKPDGSPVDHRQVSEVMRLKPPLFVRIWNVVMSEDGGDIDPDASPYEQHMRAQREQAVASAGVNTPQAEVLEKN